MVRQEKSILFWIIPFLAVFLAVPLQLLAQGGATGAISGTVRDQSGAVLAGANVAIISEATGQTIRQLKTDASGVFSAPLLPVGTYTVEVNAAGFALSKFTGVEVRITETTSMTAILQVAAVKEVVEVQSQVVPVDTTDAVMGESVGSTTVTSLPLATRNFQQLLDLSAGASANLNNAAGLGRGNVVINVNGAREDNNNYLIEGISASDYAMAELTYTPVPNPDSIQEFKVSTSLYDASQGRNGGGNMDAVLKSGTSSFHGDLWEYFRNSKLDAADYFVGPFVLKQNIFGGDFGGPVAPKGKLGYFYVNYQGTRQRSGDSLGTYLSDVPLPVLPADRSAQSLISAFFPNGLPSYDNVNTGNGYGGLDPLAYQLLNVTGTQFGTSPGGYLIPTVPGTPGSLNGTLSVSTPGSYREDQFTANWDREFNHAKDHLAERFFWSDGQTNEPFGGDGFQIVAGGAPSSGNLDFPLLIPLRSRFGSIAETHTFTDALINEFHFGVNISNYSFQNVPVAGTSAANLGIVNGSGATFMPRFQFANGLQIGPFPGMSYGLMDSLSWLDTVSWTHGRHLFRFGGEIDTTSLRDNGAAFPDGVDNFFPGSDFSLNYFQNFLLGQPSYGVSIGGDTLHNDHVPAFAAFAQDDYRVTPALTLNLGFRTEWVGANYDNDCAIGNVNLALLPTTGDPFVYPSCVSKYNFPGLTGTLNKAGTNNEYATVLEPRIGFAYAVGGKQKTIIHSGYGYYSTREDNETVENSTSAAPFSVAAVVAPTTPDQMATLYSSLPALGEVSAAFIPTPAFFQGFTNCSTGAVTTDTTQCPAFSGGATSAYNQSMPMVPLHWIVPTMQQWNLTVERQLGGNWVLEIGYVGTKGTHMRAYLDPDQPSLASPSNPVTVTCGNAAMGAPCLQPGVATGGQVVITENTASNAGARAQYLGANPVNYFALLPDSDSHYSALQATVSHHFARGLYFLGAYTWSKSIDDVSTATTAYFTRLNNQLSAAASRGLSDFNRASRLTASFNYGLPSPGGGGSLVKYALGNWETGGVIVVQSGTPFSIMDANAGTVYQVESAAPNGTANFAPGHSCSNALNTGSFASKLANWVNPAAYQPAPVVGIDGSTGWGDSPRNCIVGPGQWNVDFTLNKTFSLMEHQRLLFRTEFFNLFNHPSFESPAGTNFNEVELGSEIGKITQTVGTPRLVQFSLKYIF